MKHIPVRTCIVCGKKTYKHLLDRYVYLNGKFVLDKDKKMEGRGFYICREESCQKKAMKKLSSIKSKIERSS